jgi:hypothetical protein
MGDGKEERNEHIPDCDSSYCKMTDYRPDG